MLRVAREGSASVMADSSTHLEVALNLDFVHSEISVPNLTRQARIVVLFGH